MNVRLFTMNRNLEQDASVQKNPRGTRGQFRSGGGGDAVIVREFFGLTGKSILVCAPLDEILSKK